MARQKTTLMIDETLLRQVRISAARTGRSQSDVLEEALRNGLEVFERIAAKANANEKEILKLASEIVHEIRATRARDEKPAPVSSRAGRLKG